MDRLIGCSVKITTNVKFSSKDKNFGKIGVINKYYHNEDDYLIEFKSDTGFYCFREFKILSLGSDNSFEPIGNGQRKLCYWCGNNLKHISYLFNKVLCDTNYCPKCLR